MRQFYQAHKWWFVYIALLFGVFLSEGDKSHIAGAVGALCFAYVSVQIATPQKP